MFKLLPQILVIVAIATIIIIVLRRIPQVTIREEDSDGSGSRASGKFQKNLRFLAHGITNVVSKSAKKLAELAAEAKNHTGNSKYLSQFYRVVKKPAHLEERQDEVQKSSVQTVDSTDEEKRLLKNVEENPSSRDAYEKLGKYYSERKRYSDSKEVYEHLTKNFPQEDTYYSKLGFALYNLELFEEASEAYRSAIKLKPDGVSRYVNLSLCYAGMQDINRAVESLEKALSLSPENTQYLLLLGDYLIQLGDNETAQDILGKVLEIEPTNSIARDKLMKLKF